MWTKISLITVIFLAIVNIFIKNITIENIMSITYDTNTNIDSTDSNSNNLFWY